MFKKSASPFCLTFWLGLWAACSLVHAQPAANDDDGYRVYQDHAPNFIRIEITNVSVNSNKTLWFAASSDRVEVEARVLQVIRSKDGIQPGMLIPIIYDRKAAAGGSFANTPGIPKRGEILPAFIKVKGDHFVPAALHHTFSPLTETQLAKLDRKNIELSETQIAELRQQSGSPEITTTAGAELPMVSDSPSLRAEVAIPDAVLPTEPELREPAAPVLVTRAPDPIPTAPSTSVEDSINGNLDQNPPLPQPDVTTPVIETTPAIQDRSGQRRTVVVITPSELRSRRAAQVAASTTAPVASTEPTNIEPIRTEPTPTPEPEIPVLRAEPVPVAEAESSPTTRVLSTEPPIRIVSSSPEEVLKNNAEISMTGQAAEEIAAEEPPVLTEPIMLTEDPKRPVDNNPDSTPSATEPIQITEVDAPVSIPMPDPASPAPSEEASLSSSESDRTNMKTYAEIYSVLQSASTAAAEGKFSEARGLYENALLSLQNMKARSPDFQPFMVEYRIRDTGRKLEEMILKAGKAGN